MSEIDHDNVVTQPRVAVPGTGVQTTPMCAESGAMFCPRGGVNAGATKRVGRQTTQLLQGRLKILTPFLAAVELLAGVRFLFVNPPAAIVPFASAALALVATVLLYRQPRMPRGLLLVVKTVIVLGTLVLALAVNQYLVLSARLAAGDHDGFLADINRVPGLWLMVIVAYAMFIPDTWKQAAAFVGICVAADASVAAALRLRYGPITGVLGTEELIDMASFGLVLFIAAGGLAVFGTHAMHEMRRTMAEMGDAGMYRLVGKLGAGGMGEVWKAEHRLLSRQTAIKIIRPDLLDTASSIAPATVIGRFEREARATASLQSPHTVQLYDFGVTRDGTFFYVMEFLRGLDLDELVKRFGPLPPARAVHLLKQAAESLHEAHQRGTVHRDVKPGNIHVGALAGRHDWVKALDFGLVKSFRDETQDSLQLTQEGVTTGTPAYFPPEMAQDAAHADGRSDVYALAAVGYFLLTGELVFDGAGPMDMVVKHIRDEPVPPSQRVELEIPESLDAAILAGLRKSPDDRPQSMLEFARLLDEALEGPTWNEARAADSWKLHLPDEVDSLAGDLRVA